MNKMLHKEVIDYTSKNKHSVSFFEDDSIEIIRQRIGVSLNTHPDRLFILVGLRLPANYYTSDPRRWEALFERLSYNGQPIEKDSFEQYQTTYRLPNTTIPYTSYDRVEWMNYPESLKSLHTPESDFIEYRIFGVSEDKSFVMPVDFTSTFITRIPSARLPIPENTKLVSTVYGSHEIESFLVRSYDESAEQYINFYYPLLRTTTPNQVSEETVRLLTKNTELLNGLLKLDVPEPTKVTFVRTRFYIPWVDTDFGSAVRTRFEQMFYGLTVSEDIPYIGFFTSKDQVTRHKFYVEDPSNKKTFLDKDVWASWWALTKPARNIPTLVLYSGKSKHDFDRIAITSRDLVISTHRSEENSDSIQQLKKHTLKWLKSFDSIFPFIDERDIQDERWELQDLSFLAKYETKMEDFDLLRFQCLSSIFDIADKTKSQFSLLRTDHENDGITSVEVKLLQMIRDGTVLRAEDISNELSIPIGEAQVLIRRIEDRLDEDPKLVDRAFRGFPSFRVGPDFILTSSVSDYQHPLKYANILRYILSNPDSDSLNKLCPKRMEKVAVDRSEIKTSDAVEIDAALADEYADLFEYLEEEAPAKEETQSIAESEESTERISTEQAQKTTYSYFKNRLSEFDKDTFDFPGSQYPKKCEKNHQPIILSSADMKRLDNTPYDVTEYLKEDQIVDLENPDGKLVCPEYWCMRDQIPLQESQIDHTSGVARCPVCKGKLMTSANDNPREFPLIKRQTGFVYPGFVNYKSPKTGKFLPCCFQKSRASKNKKVGEETEEQDKYYIIGETKTGLKPLRNALLTKEFIDSLRIPETYETIVGKTRRLASGMSGFFRVGLGHPKETLSTLLLGKNVVIPSPRESIETTLKCSFLRTWAQPSDTYAKEIENELKKNTEFQDTFVRENLARLISGIDEAYSKKQLSKIQELEYCALALNCDIFRVDVETNSMKCMFYAPMTRPRTRGILVLEDEEDIDIVSHVTRLSRGFEYKSNVFESPFKKETYIQLEKLRNEACSTEIPSYETALRVMPEIATDDYQIILDPFGRGQAFYIPESLILPFQPTPLPDVLQPKLAGYTEVTQLPKYETVLDYLKKASKIAKGYAWKEDLLNGKGECVEVLTESGLRIPVQPEVRKKKDPLEVIQTVQEIGESQLTFGESSEELKKRHDKISYAAEVYEFLLFQLTKDLVTEYRDLRKALQEVRPSQKEVEPLLRSWFNETTQFVNLDKPVEFLSKVRTPCGQFKKEQCSGNMCGWDGKTCRIQIQESTVQKDRVFHRLLSTLLDNVKIRSVVLENRTTPFFSTILYLELPHELIVSDLDIINI